METVETIPLSAATRERYLSYALSVITSRALPDVRDGLKPVQRRILYTMFRELSLHPGGRYRKCAAVVGDVMGKYHPHGDQSIYDALVRMAQDFSLRAMLVDGQGNFGSLDGDPPAAMRYTECRLRPIAEELLQEIRKRTVDFRPTYDGQRFEPVTLPATFPQLLVNGCEGIAVGMATRIPPHNLGEVIDASVASIEARLEGTDLQVEDLMAHIKGPDFPTGAKILNSRAELQSLYETGTGSIRIRATWNIESGTGRKQVVIDSVPYGQNKSKLIERIGQAVIDRKLPQVLDVRDESTDIVRVVLDLKRGASAEATMAYLYKHTALECSYPVNLTALVPSDRPDVCVPARLDLKTIIDLWLQFRFETVKRRLTYDLEQLEERIHILEGLSILFLDLDRAIKIIRESDGKRDAAGKLMAAFELDEIQVDAILELKLYRLAKLEIALIVEELEEKRAQAAEIRALLGSDQALWQQVRSELLEVRRLYFDERRTIVGEPVKSLAYDEDAYIVKEDTYVVVTRDGWMKRQSSFSELNKIRVREDDEVGWLFRASTRSTITFFSSLGAAYVLRVDDIVSTTGYGVPVQSNFSFADGERIVGVVSHDARHFPDRPDPTLFDSDTPPPPYGIAMTQGGRVLRFPMSSHEDISTKSGRKYARLNKGDAVLVVYPSNGDEKISVASGGGRAMLFPSSEVPFLRAAGKGVTGIKLRDDDQVLAMKLVSKFNDGVAVVTALGRRLVVSERGFSVTTRGNRGRVVLKRGSIDVWERDPMVRLGKLEETEDDTEPEDEE